VENAYVHTDGDIAIETRQSRGMDISRLHRCWRPPLGGQRLEAVAREDVAIGDETGLSSASSG
jgi:hypothetical protein